MAEEDKQEPLALKVETHYHFFVAIQRQTDRQTDVLTDKGHSPPAIQTLQK